jgi:hypothetical protein
MALGKGMRAMTTVRNTIGLWVLAGLLLAGCTKEKPAAIDPHSPAGVNMALQALQSPLAEALKTNDLQFIHKQMDYILRLAENLPYQLQGEQKQRVDDLLAKLKHIAEETDNSSGRKQLEATAVNLEKMFAALKELDAEFTTTPGKK